MCKREVEMSSKNGSEYASAHLDLFMDIIRRRSSLLFSIMTFKSEDFADFCLSDTDGTEDDSLEEPKKLSTTSQGRKSISEEFDAGDSENGESVRDKIVTFLARQSK